MLLFQSFHACFHVLVCFFLFNQECIQMGLHAPLVQPFLCILIIVVSCPDPPMHLSRRAWVRGYEFRAPSAAVHTGYCTIVYAEAVPYKLSWAARLFLSAGASSLATSTFNAQLPFAGIPILCHPSSRS